MRTSPRPPGETDSARVPVALTGAVIGSAVQQIVQLGHPDLIAGQELSAPPSQSALSVLADQGQAFRVGE